MEWPQLASPVNGLVLRIKRLMFGQNRTAMHEAMAPIWIQAERGNPRNARSGADNAKPLPLPATPDDAPDADADVDCDSRGGLADGGGDGATVTVLLTATPPRDSIGEDTTIDRPGKRGEIASPRAEARALASAFVETTRPK